MRLDWKTYALGVAAALVLLLAGAWPRAQATDRNLDGQPGYFWHTAAASTRISPDAALGQSARVAAERRLSQARVDALIARSTHNDTYNLTARPEVDVAELNDRLDGRLP